MKTLNKKILLLIIDAALINLAVYIALIFRFDGKIPEQYIQIFKNTFIYITLIEVMIYYLFGLYKSLWNYASIDELIQVFFATSVGAVGIFTYGTIIGARLPRTVYAMAWILMFLFAGGIRISGRLARRMQRFSKNMGTGVRKVMIVGAGQAGSMVIKELKDHQDLNMIPAVVVDDDTKKHNSYIHGVPVKGGRDKLIQLAKEYGIDEIIIAVPSAQKSEISDILRICKETKCKLKKLPGVYEIINEDVSIKNIRDVNIEDLLGRDEVNLNIKEISGYIKNETVLVTGGGGSIGSELCRQIARFHPRKLIILDIYENNAYDLQQELKQSFKNKLNMEVVIASVRDKKRLEQVFDKYRPGLVFHAAAHKHVPLMEDNPPEAVKNNVIGTLNAVQCADKYKIKKFVMISTDKAVNPTNVMGATKRVSEIIIQAMDKRSQTEFVAVRFGNVLGSNGSVIPLFKKQIEAGGPVTVTHPEITRYFMTIPEAARLVIQAGAMAKGGEIFILDMGQSVKILDLAKDLIRLSGFEPDIDIKIEFTGLRPGEKLYEELLLAEEGIESTRHKSIFIGKPLELDYEELIEKIKDLEASLDNTQKIKDCLSSIVINYDIENSEAAVTK
ncbi:MAG: nucleoside-diphosphate sugar epimerase/dehydratase [Clostridiaceae bacterium]|nr:nucleoside-diphosphate sugar epimerase/dehydratase [Clostridiaceae bacterium]